ncbi:3-oxoadipate enol-lactonase [Noviherbaspirillum sp. ST9]|uniref:3-oxoadipate enol-lactonase n=1 Tax=Noviherbaspirillum sp. ST9 TaxID=3401606 RepID=UPI003B588DD0
MPVAELGNTRIYYRIDGEPGKSVLVLSNSLGTSLEMWAPQAEALSEHFQVLRYDTRGHGQSGVPPGPYTMSILAADVVGLLDHLGIAKAHFCGLSLGGITGMRLALDFPERIDRLVLCNTAAFIGPPGNWTARAEKVRAEGMGAIADAVVTRWLTPDFAEGHADLVTGLRRMLVATDAEGYAANCCAVRDADLREEVRHITAPTLVIAGSGDVPTPPSDAAYLAATIPGAQYVELEAAHISNLQQPVRFTAAVLAFLKRQT